MSSRVVLRSKKVSETCIFTFDFIGLLALTDTVTSGAASMSIHSGTDANPQAMVSGASTVRNGRFVDQVLTFGVAGNIYLVTITAATAASRTLSISGYLAILP